MRFYLFLLVNAALFVRPAEIVPGLEGVPIYEALIVTALVATGPAILRQLTLRSLQKNPITIGVLALPACVALSHLSHGQAGLAIEWGETMLKIVAYYLLLVSVMDSPARLRRFLTWIGAMIVGVSLLALLDHFDYIDLAFQSLRYRELDSATGEMVDLERLCGPGIFNDPNDLSMILVVGMMIGVSRLGESGTWRRGFWLVPLSIMGFALSLTHSRGGFLTLMAAITSLMAARFGLKRTLLVASPLLIGLFTVFEGRQTSIDLTDQNDTSQHRIRLWRDGLQLLQRSPVFGIGAGRFHEEAGLVAHNSFVHAYAELGVVGGTTFLALFVYPAAVLFRLGANRQFPPVFRRLRTPILASAIGVAFAMLSLSRVYTLTPYIVLGLVAADFQLMSQWAPGLAPPLASRLVGRIIGLSAATLAAITVFVRIFAGQS